MEQVCSPKNRYPRNPKAVLVIVTKNIDACTMINYDTGNKLLCTERDLENFLCSFIDSSIGSTCNNVSNNTFFNGLPKSECKIEKLQNQNSKDMFLGEKQNIHGVA